MPESQHLLGQVNTDENGVPRETTYTKETSCHSVSLFLNVLVLGATVMIVASVVISDSSRWPPWPVSLVVFGVSLFAYLLEACCYSHTLQYLRHTKTAEGTVVFMQRLQSARPIIEMHVDCYHYETVQHTETVTDSDGNTTTQSYTTEEKVTTHTARRNKTFRSWADCSGALPDVYNAANMREVTEQKEESIEQRSFSSSTSSILQSSPPEVRVYVPRTRILKVKLNKSVKAHDIDTEIHLENEKRTFKAAHRRRDVHMDYTEKLIVPGYTPRTMIVGGPKPVYLEANTYWWATLLLVCWPYRMWVESLTSRVTWDLRKIVGLRDLQTQVHDGPLLRRATTYVSAYSVDVPIAVPVPDKAEYRHDLPTVVTPVTAPGLWVTPAMMPSAPPLRSASADRV